MRVCIILEATGGMESHEEHVLAEMEESEAERLKKKFLESKNKRQGAKVQIGAFAYKDSSGRERNLLINFSNVLMIK